MDGVSIILTSRGAQDEFAFENWIVQPLSEKTIKAALCGKGLLFPEEPQMRALLANAMMLNLFIQACGDTGEEQLVILTRVELIDAYLNALIRKENEILPDESIMRWQIYTAVRCVYPLIAELEDRKQRGVTSAELLEMMDALYGILGKWNFTSLFPDLVGHADDIRGDAKDCEAWYGKMILELLWHRLYLINQDENGAFRIAHQDFREAVLPQGQKIRKVMKKTIPLKKRLLRYALAALLVVACYICLSMAVKEAMARKELHEQQYLALDLKNEIKNTQYQNAILRSNAELYETWYMPVSGSENTPRPVADENDSIPSDDETQEKKDGILSMSTPGLGIYINYPLQPEN